MHFVSSETRLFAEKLLDNVVRGEVGLPTLRVLGQSLR